MRCVPHRRLCSSRKANRLLVDSGLYLLVLKQASANGLSCEAFSILFFLLAGLCLVFLVTSELVKTNKKNNEKRLSHQKKLIIPSRIELE